MKFRKTALVEATQWFKHGDHPSVVRVPIDVQATWASRDHGEYMESLGWIGTLEGGHVVDPGDWIITNPSGEQYPCKPDIFARTYEPAE